MSQSLTDRYDDRIAGMLSCYDRLVITGTLPVVCYAAGMTGYLNAKGIRIFDYPEFAKTLRDRVRDRAVTLAAEAGVTIEHIAKPHVRKEDVVARVLRQRGDHPGLVHIISAMEACDAYKPPAFAGAGSGTTSRHTGPSSGRTAASACTIISTFRMPSLGWSIFACRPGRRSAYNSTATATAGWRAS
jgi:hypothetical protein